MRLLQSIIAVLLCLTMASCRNSTPPDRWTILKTDICDSIKHLSTDFEKTCFIRSYIATLTDVPDGDRNNVAVLYPEYRDFSLSRLVGIFEKDSAGANCGPASHFLKLALRDLGFNCSELDVGDHSGNTSHVACLVTILDKGKKIAVVQDALYNTSITDTGNNPLDYQVVKHLLDSGNTVSLKMMNTVNYCDALIDTIPPLNQQQESDCLPLVKKQQTDKLRVKYRVPKTIEFLLLNCSTNAAGYLDMIEEKGYTRNIINLYAIDPTITK